MTHPAFVHKTSHTNTYVLSHAPVDCLSFSSSRSPQVSHSPGHKRREQVATASSLLDWDALFCISIIHRLKKREERPRKRKVENINNVPRQQRHFMSTSSRMFHYAFIFSHSQNYSFLLGYLEAIRIGIKKKKRDTSSKLD